MLTVLTPAKSARLVTLENARIDMNLSVATFPNNRLARLIDQASSRAATYCNRAFGRQIYRERILSMPREGFLFDVGPVNRIISVGILGGAIYDPDDYLLDDGKLRLTYGSGTGIGDGAAWNLWRSLQPTLVVDYEAGWLLPGEQVGDTFTGSTPLPADVENAVTKLLGVAVSEAGRDVTIRQESNEGVGSVSYYVQGATAGLPHPGAEAALQPYRRMALV